MIFEFSPWGVLISFGWLLCVPRELLVPVLVSLMIFCSPSISVGLLLLVLLQIFSFVQSSVGMRRENNGVAQKRFMVVMAGAMIAIFGHAMGPCWQGRALGLLGLLLIIPNGFTTFFFARFYERLTLKSYLGAVVIPAFSAIAILFKWKNEIREDVGDGYGYAILGVGALTVLLAGAMGFSRLRIRPVLVFWTQLWIGFAVLALAATSDTLISNTIATIAVFSVSGALLMSLASQIGRGSYVFARVAALGGPGFIGFMALFFVMKVLFELGLEWVMIGFIGFMVQAVTLILCKPKTPMVSNRKARVRFWIVVGVQAIAGSGLSWLALGGPK
jgi:hypothetical protein